MPSKAALFFDYIVILVDFLDALHSEILVEDEELLFNFMCYSVIFAIFVVLFERH